MGVAKRRLLLGLLIVGSVVFTPVFGALGPFRGGEPPDGPREYFLPAGYAFSVWGVNYLGLIALGVWQALAGQRDNPRAASAAPWLAATALCNPVWIVLAGIPALMPWTVPVLLVMEVTAWVAYFRLGVPAGRSLPRMERLLHWPLRVYVGWLSVATVANSAAALNALRWDGFGIDPVTWTVIMLVAATIVAAVVGELAGNDNVYRGVFVWAFVGIVVAQRDVPAVAGTAAVLALALSLLIAFTRRRASGRRAELAPVV